MVMIKLMIKLMIVSLLLHLLVQSRLVAGEDACGSCHYNTDNWCFATEGDCQTETTLSGCLSWAGCCVWEDDGCDPPTPAPDYGDLLATLKTCELASNVVFALANPQYQDVSNDLFDFDMNDDYHNYEACINDFIDGNGGNDATCVYDWVTHPLFDSYKTECKDAGGIVYVWDSRFECRKTGYRINGGFSKSPYCISVSESSCDIPTLDGELDSYAQANNDYFESYGFSCELKQSDFHTLDSSGRTDPNISSAYASSALAHALYMALTIILLQWMGE